MDNFFDLFDEIDLQNIDKILINPDEQNKIQNLYKNLKNSANLPYVAAQVRQIKDRFTEPTGITYNFDSGENFQTGGSGRGNSRGGVRQNINHAANGYGRTGRGRGAGRGNHRNGQIVNNANVQRRQAIRNEINQISHRQNPIVNLRNNQSPRQLVFDSQFTDPSEIMIHSENQIFIIELDLKIYPIINNFKISYMLALIN